MRLGFLLVFGLATLCAGHSAAAEEKPLAPLPFDLRFFMSPSDVMDHLKPFETYRKPLGEPGQIRYSLEDQSTGHTIMLNLLFSPRGLVEISSTRGGFSRKELDAYLAKTLEIVETWKVAGITVISEEPEDESWIYRDDRAYISLLGGETNFEFEGQAEILLWFAIVFSERDHYWGGVFGKPAD